MQHPFAALAPEYAAMRVAQTPSSTLPISAAPMSGSVAATGAPTRWGRASFERESGSDYMHAPGTRLKRAPRGLGTCKSRRAQVGSIEA
jgi:hypothetical protein